MALHAFGAGHDEHRIIQHRQCALHLRRKIDVPGCIDKEIFIFPMMEYRLVGKDRNAALFLQRMRIQKRILMIDAPHRSQAVRMVKQRLRKCGLARIDVRQYAQSDLHCALTKENA